MHRFEFDTTASLMSFEARSTVHPVCGDAAGLEGWIDVDLDGGASTIRAGLLEIPLAQLSSGNAIYDAELRRRLGLRRHPMLRAELTSWTPNGEQGTFLVRGDVTFRGVTRTEGGEMAALIQDDRTVVLEGVRVFDIRDYGMKPPHLLSLRMHPEVKVRVAIIGRRID
ncbi:MAG TPA: YceI family protein [Acidimicrobiales bacterium]|nr:YceI family protein [Acidimicrobiales bacterium]